MKSLLLAVGVMSLGKLLFATQDVIIKYMSGAYPVHEIVSIRGLVAIPLLLLITGLSIGLPALRRHKPWLHLLRGGLMFLAFLAYYVALSEMSLINATALFFTAPFFITILSIPFLGEKVGLRRVLSIVGGFIGVLVVLRPSSAGFDAIALLPIVAAFFYAVCQVMVRYAGMTAPAVIMSLYASIAFLLLGLLTGLVLIGVEPGSGDASSRALLQPWSIPPIGDFLLLACTGVTSALGFMFASYAYQNAEASQLAPFEYLLIVWVALLSYLVWGEIPDQQTLIGVAIIIASGIYVLKREKQARALAYTGLTRR